jgi:hypothetical protein
VGSDFPPSLRFRLRAKRSGATSTKLEERSRVGDARGSAKKRGGGSRTEEIRLSQETNSAEVDINIDEMRRTNHISLARVAANGAAPPGAQA